ncbi:MAG: hypothetical protein MZW92_78455 [Comamonadaceae bacterium]|nr:hypothetical protein [Comamonadaceae bacterium]
MLGERGHPPRVRGDLPRRDDRRRHDRRADRPPPAGARARWPSATAGARRVTHYRVIERFRGAHPRARAARDRAARTRSACTSRTPATRSSAIAYTAGGSRCRRAPAKRCGPRCVNSRGRRCTPRGWQLAHPVTGRPLECVAPLPRRHAASCSPCWPRDAAAGMTHDRGSTGLCPTGLSPAHVRRDLDRCAPEA